MLLDEEDDGTINKTQDEDTPGGYMPNSPSGYDYSKNYKKLHDKMDDNA